VCIEREQLVAVRLEHEIVDEQPHTDAAVGGSQEVVDGNQPDVVRREDEVLDVDRMLGGLGEPGARDHRYISLFERETPVLVRIRGASGASSRESFASLVCICAQKAASAATARTGAGDPLHAAISNRQARATTTGFNQVVGLLGLPIRRQ
jgi:hypothetical protein